MLSESFGYPLNYVRSVMVQYVLVEDNKSVPCGWKITLFRKGKIMFDLNLNIV